MNYLNKITIIFYLEYLASTLAPKILNKTLFFYTFLFEINHKNLKS